MSNRARRMTVLGVAAVVAAQSAAHLVAVFVFDRVGSFVDLERSNGAADLISELVLAAAAAGAFRLAWAGGPKRRPIAVALAISLSVLTIDDVIHDGPHPSSWSGKVVIACVVGTVALLVVLASRMEPRARLTALVAIGMLAASFVVSDVDHLVRWFESDRGDIVDELQIVAKEALELGGWSLVALALWDQALRDLPRPKERPAIQPSEDGSRR
jgi:hypothetical protein